MILDDSFQCREIHDQSIDSWQKHLHLIPVVVHSAHRSKCRTTVILATMATCWMVILTA